VFVFDTSAYINGARHHYPYATFPSLWDLIGEAMGDGRIIAPRAVFTEIDQKDDDVCAWVRQRPAAFVEPSEDVQRRAGEIQAALPRSHTRDEADPWVVAEAGVRGLTVVTYEGQTFSGVPTTRWHRQMPGICNQFEVRCRTLPEALGELGGTF
jgi:hypothetical protein